jgi:hypothetical protein
MADEASETWGGAVKNWLGALGFILPMAAIEEAVRHFVDVEHPSIPLWVSATLIVAGLLIFASPAGWKQLKKRGRKTMAAIVIVISAVGLMLGVYLLANPATPRTEITKAGGSSSPESQVNALAPRATLQLLMRPNQDPLELSRDNVWRWYAFKTMGRDAAGNSRTIATFIYLTFDHPVQTNYRRVFSSSDPKLRFDVLDLTERSMVIGINDTDISGATIDVQVSGSPL